jgi:hypothetical protein
VGSTPIIGSMLLSRASDTCAGFLNRLTGFDSRARRCGVGEFGRPRGPHKPEIAGSNPASATILETMRMVSRPPANRLRMRVPVGSTPTASAARCNPQVGARPTPWRVLLEWPATGVEYRSG